MSTNNTKTGKPRFIKPPNKLKMKVGHGGIDPMLLDKSQNFIETSDLDFTPYAKNFMEQLEKAIKSAEKDETLHQDLKNKVIGPIMQLKASGGMFRYQLVSDVADICLQFLESIDEINKDAIAVLKAHENTIKIIINNKLRGDGGSEGYALVKELDGACNRYFSKHKS